MAAEVHPGLPGIGKSEHDRGAVRVRSRDGLWQPERRLVFWRRPIATAWVIALRVVGLLVFESRASIARVATHLPPPSAIALKIACKTRCSARLNTPR